MKIIGCDFHPSYQQIVMWDKATGEMLESLRWVARARASGDRGERAVAVVRAVAF